MALSHNPRIVTDGLVLCLDAANPKSYSGSGTTWKDLSGNGNNGTLVNGVGYSNDNGGSMVFDGVNDYIELTERNTNLEFQPNQSFSVFCWIYNLTKSNQGAAIISNMLGFQPYTGWDLYRDGNMQETIGAHLISSWSDNALKVVINFDYLSNANKWVNVGYTYNGSVPTNSTDALNSINFYVNGQLETSGKSLWGNTIAFNSKSEIISYNSLQRFRIMSRWSANSFLFGSSLTTSQVFIYNSALTESEVQQNYNALKGRFNL